MTQTIDATNQIMGRLATQVATKLRGKDKKDYAPNKIVGDEVIVYNAEKIKISGKKFTEKKYQHHTGFMGHLKEKSYAQLFNKNPSEVIKRAVAGMLPKNRLRKQFLKRLKIVTGPINEPR